jgi:hypothetical protein
MALHSRKKAVACLMILFYLFVQRTEKQHFYDIVHDIVYTDKNIVHDDIVYENKPIVRTSSSSEDDDDDDEKNILPEVDDVSSCPRFARLRHTLCAGLGHKITEIVFGMVFAQETHSSFVFDDNVWSHVGDHGSYEWLTDVLPFQDSEVTLSGFNNYNKKRINAGYDGVEVINGRWSELLEQSVHGNRSCGVFYETELTQCCDEEEICVCTMSKIDGFERFKWRLREVFLHTKSKPKQQLDDFIVSKNISQENIVKIETHSINIVWHVRGGDIVLNANKEYFDRLASQIASVLTEAKLSAQIFFFGEDVLGIFPFLPQVCQMFFPGKCFYTENVDVKDTFYHMVKSDMLVTSGSSFAAVAALFRIDGVVLSAFPKEGLVGVYEVSEQGLIGKNGTIEKPSLDELGFQLRAVHSRKMKKRL